MNYNPENKKPRNILSNESISEIKECYALLHSISKTAIKLGYSKNTVNKYVRSESSKDKHSRYNNIPIVQLIPETLEQVRKYSSAYLAAKINHIGYSNMVRALNGKQLTAGGYIWAYENNKPTQPVLNYYISFVRQEDILLGLK